MTDGPSAVGNHTPEPLGRKASLARDPAGTEDAGVRMTTREAMVTQYDCEVNRADLNMRALADRLNERYEDGWRLAHIFEQGGN
jgi:hypothetical protein